MTRGPRRTLRATGLAAACALGLAVAGCRSCTEERFVAVDAGPPQPTMPTGMLVPGATASAIVDAGAGSALHVTRGMRGGAWTELQIAAAGDRPERVAFEHWRDDSVFVSLEAMTLMHEAFARALSGFDLFLPRLFDPAALTKLAAELESVAQRTSGDIAGAARELAQLARGTSVKGESLWVLGP